MMTNTDKPQSHPDIEIYLKSVAPDQIESWLTQRFGNLEHLKHSRRVHQYQLAHSGHRIPVLVVENAAKAFSSILFESTETPWEQDIQCAREAFTHFGKEVRCIASGWNDGDEPDEWIAVTAEGESTIIWRT